MNDAPHALDPTTLALTVGELSSNPVRVVRRQAVRAVIRRADQLLMVHSTVAGDYKFPGGGIEAGESPAEALAREVREECGVAVVRVAGTPTIVVEERRPGQESGVVLSMQSSYHVCTVDHGQALRRDLDPYEADLGFEPAWMTVEDALRVNTEVLGRGRPPRPGSRAKLRCSVYWARHPRPAGHPGCDPMSPVSGPSTGGRVGHSRHTEGVDRQKVRLGSAKA